MILDGKKAAADLFVNLKQKLDEWKLATGIIPKLSVIQVGNNAASSKYITLKGKKCKEIGIDFEHILLPETITQDEIISVIFKLNKNPDVHAILVQLPLPQLVDTREIIEAIDPNKDVDCLTSHNIGNFVIGTTQFMPATPLGIIRLLDYYNISLTGKFVCVIGRSNLVGKPLALALTALDATVTVCHSRTIHLEEYTKKADIVISAVGNAKFLDTRYFNANQVVIDVGTSLDSEQILSGDVDFNNVVNSVKAITPVPGGVGPMTIYGLLENCTKLLGINL